MCYLLLTRNIILPRIVPIVLFAFLPNGIAGFTLSGRMTTIALRNEALLMQLIRTHTVSFNDVVSFAAITVAST
jgi:hypothetical protein